MFKSLFGDPDDGETGLDNERAEAHGLSSATSTRTQRRLELDRRLAKPAVASAERPLPAAVRIGRLEAKGETMTTEAGWRDQVLGEPRELVLPQGRLRAYQTGEGAPIVFVHGVLVNANLWRKVVTMLSPDFRCVALDLPLGSHTLPMPDGADLSPPGLADLIADTIEALGLEDVTLVGNDTGGALCQIAVTRRPERIGRLVLTSCDYRDNFPPAMFSYFKLLPRISPLLPALFAPMRLRAARRLPFAFGWLSKRPIDHDAEDSYFLPILGDRRVRADLSKVIRGLDTRYTNDAADKLGAFGKPALIAWSREDRFFKPEHARRLAEDLPNSRLEWVDDARTFSMEDNPRRVAELIAGFVRDPPPPATP
jgi:pimeloyl-ACP methyl ester carboxylesterase